MDIELWKQKKKELGYTFVDLSAMTGISTRTLKSLFVGERTNTTTFTVQAIEKALGIVNKPVVELSPIKKELIEIVSQLNEENVIKALEILKVINK